MTSPVPWSDIETADLIRLRGQGVGWDEISRTIGRTTRACETHWLRANVKNISGPLPVSTQPLYNEPLQMEGNALVLPDAEFPFHHSDFINHCLDIADAWKINQAIVAGDALHLDSMSKWGAEWEGKRGSSLTDDDEKELRTFVEGLPEAQRVKGMGLLERIAPASADGLSDELALSRRMMRLLAEQFKRVDYVLGNHETRFIRALNMPMMPQDLLTMLKLEEPKWRISPYFYSLLTSNGEQYRIEHPVSAAKYTAQKLADKFCMHVLMAHSHALSVGFSTSGRYWAIQMGCCVDENRLPYASQRSTTRDMHLNGAVIVRDGFPWLLSARSDWEKLRKMK